MEVLDFARLGSAASCRGCGKAQCVPVAGANRADGRPLVAGQDLAECRKPYELFERAGTPDTRTPLSSRGCPRFACGSSAFLSRVPGAARLERASENQRQVCPVDLASMQGVRRVAGRGRLRFVQASGGDIALQRIKVPLPFLSHLLFALALIVRGGNERHGFVDPDQYN